MQRYSWSALVLCLAAAPACNKHGASADANKAAQHSSSLYDTGSQVSGNERPQSAEELRAASDAERERMGLPPQTEAERATASAASQMSGGYTEATANPTHGNPPGTYTAPGTIKAVAPAQGTSTKKEVLKGTDVAAADSGNAPTEQGTSSSDRLTTQRIRRSLLDDDALSYSAKNVQITTRNGDVTLRGLVMSDKERWEVERKARGYAGSGQVFNKLGIKSQPMPALE